MPSIPIVSGIYTDGGPDVRTAYPVNMMPVPKGSGVSDYYLRPHDGVALLGSGPGIDRGGIEWRGVCYRVMGTKLVSVSATGAATILGDVGGTGYVTMDYDFDRIGIVSGQNLYFWDGATLTQNTDPDLGPALDVAWIDGYWMTTDGENLVVTDLGNPLSVNPLKYGSSEIDPDPVVAIVKLRNEIYAVNRHTIEVFDNIGGEFFPFQRIDGAQIQKGAVGTHACCVFAEMLAFVGSGRNESLSVYLGANASTQPISTQDIDDVLKQYPETTLSQIKIESRIDRAHKLLYIHLPDRTLVYDHAASQVIGAPVWFNLTTALDGFAEYRARNFVWCYDKWVTGDPQQARTGYLDDTISSHWGEVVRWEFSTPIVYNQSRGAIVHELELVALTGRVAVPTASIPANPPEASFWALLSGAADYEMWNAFTTNGFSIFQLPRGSYPEASTSNQGQIGFSNATGSRVAQTFESFSVGPISVSSYVDAASGVTVTINNGVIAANAIDETDEGRYSVAYRTQGGTWEPANSGTKSLVISTSTLIEINFSKPIASFGTYLTDYLDFSGSYTWTLSRSGATLFSHQPLAKDGFGATIATGSVGLDGSVGFIGYRAKTAAALFDKLTIQSSGSDAAATDNWFIGTVEQIPLLRINVGQQLQFADTSTNAPTSWLWDFGDGTTSTLQNPTKTYSATGTRTVSLTVSNSGGSDVETKTGYVVIT